MQSLLERAVEHNPQLKVAQQEQRIYQARLDAASSQYWPTVDLVASFSRGDSEDLATLSQRTNTYAVGVQVNIPLFTGGYTTANRRATNYKAPNGVTKALCKACSPNCANTTASTAAGVHVFRPYSVPWTRRSAA